MSSLALNNIDPFLFLILFMVSGLYLSLLIRMHFKRHIQAYLIVSLPKEYSAIEY